MLVYDNYGNLVFTGVALKYHNFGGKPKPGGPPVAERSIGIIIDAEDAEILKNQGWNIKYSTPDSNGNVTTYIPVCIRYDPYPPVIEVFTSSGKHVMTEDTVGTLDGAMINVRPDGRPWADVVIRGSKWEKNGNHGVKAYLQKARFGLIENNSYASDWDSYSVNEPPVGLDETPF